MNNDEYAKKAIDYSLEHSVLPLNRKQREWCEANINPNIESLQRVVELARADTDREIMQEFDPDYYNKKKKPAFNHVSKYPEGFCFYIRNGVFKRLNPNLEIESNEPIFKVIKEALTREIPIKPIYGILNGTQGKIFQNAIQLGNKIIDCAWDTGKDTRVNQVYIWDAEHGPFENITSYEQMARVTQSYQHLEVYPTNEHFPLISPIMPAMAISPDGVVEFLNGRDLVYRNVLSNFSLGYRFLKETEFRHKQVPKRFLNHIRKVSNFPGIFYENKNVDLIEMISHATEYWHGMLNGRFTPEQKKERMKTIDNVMDLTQCISRLSFQEIYGWA